MPKLQVTFPDGKKFVYPLDPAQHVITIGRTAANTITLNDNKVSRKHAQVTRNAEGYLLEDLNSQNGTLLNHKKITRHLLAHQDCFSIGSCTLTFLDEHEGKPVQPFHEGESSFSVLATLNNRRMSEPTMLLHKNANTQKKTRWEQGELEKNHKILYVLFQLSNRLNHSSDVHELLTTIMDAIFEVIDADYGFIALLDATGDTLLPQVIKGRTEPDQKFRKFRVSRTIMHEVIRKKSSVLTSNAMQDARLGAAASIRQQNLQSVISVPLWRKNKVIGMIQIDSCREDNQFQTSDLELLSTISRQIAMILDQAYLAELQRKHQFVRDTFGRYLSDEVVKAILESPDGLNLGAEKREVTILMSDLRGFTATSERLPAVDVVEMINIYLEAMTEIILRYRGTIDEFIGDAILVIFGAPIQQEDDAVRAVACALEMQLAMQDVNHTLTRKGYPSIEMGIGVHTGVVAVGNVGSKKRTKYGVVGRNVNLTSRIESYTIGGQTLISEATRTVCGSILRIDDQMQVMPKGVKEPITIYEVGGIGADFQIFLPSKAEITLVELSDPLLVEIYALDGKHTGAKAIKGTIRRLASHWGDIEAPTLFSKFTNLKLTLYDQQQANISDELYAKVMTRISEQPSIFRVNFTAIPPEVRTIIQRSIPEYRKD